MASRKSTSDGTFTDGNIKRAEAGRSGPAIPPTIAPHNLAEELRKKFTRELTFDPSDPASIFWDGGRKFSAARKVEFLQQLATHGRIGLAAHKVGVSSYTVNEHREKDPVFAELVQRCVEIYKESVVAILTTQAIEGIPEYKWDKEGNIIGFRRVLEPQLRLAILRHADPSYCETTKQEITVQPAVVQLPTPADDVGQWGKVLEALESGAALPGEGKVLEAGETAGDVTTGQPGGTDSDSFTAIVEAGAESDLAKAASGDGKGFRLEASEFEDTWQRDR